MSDLACAICDVPIEPTGRGGTARRYCSVRCRRRAEPLRDALPAMRLNLTWWQNQARLAPTDRTYRYTENAAGLAARIAAIERRTKETP